jgi:hypothetical protein
MSQKPSLMGALQPQGWAGMVTIMLLAVGFVAWVFGPAFVSGQSSFWQTDADDITQYMAGFNMYFSAPWRFPLLAFDSLNFPQGTRSTFVDAIPLYALLLKLLIPASWAPFNPYGVWVAVCFVLQAIGAWWIARELGARTWSFLLSLAIMMMTMPALLSRIGHTSLMSHWIILFAMALYLRGARQGRLATVGWCVLLVSTFYVNIYLFAMASAIYVAAIVFSLQMHRPLPDGRASVNMHSLVVAALPAVALLATLPLTLLPLEQGSLMREWGFGFYSMNLLSPIAGGYIIQLTVPVGPGQYEGFNYLGLGILAALTLALSQAALRARLVQMLRQHSALAWLMAMFIVYALSSQIYLAETQIATVTYPRLVGTVTSQFRASGRFFWPVGYLLLVALWWLFYQQRANKRFVVLALALTALQAVDLTVVFRHLQSTLARPPTVHLKHEAWNAAIPEHVRSLYFYPKFKCAKNPAHTSLLPVMHFSSVRGLNLNTGYIARYTPACDDMAREIGGSVPAESAYVFVRSEFPDISTIRSLILGTSVQCTELDFAIVCVPHP